MDYIAQAWLVRKPTDDGIVTSVELFDGSGEVIAMFFGERKPGNPELPAWGTLVSELLGRSVAVEI
jgi:putative hemin transport protein